MAAETNELRRNRFIKYFPLLLDALRSTDPTPMRPAEARAWIRVRTDVPSEDLTRLIKAKSKQTIFENDVHRARFYLLKAGLIAAPKRGFWGLTPEGRNTHLTLEETWDLFEAMGFVTLRKKMAADGNVDLGTVVLQVGSFTDPIDVSVPPTKILPVRKWSATSHKRDSPAPPQTATH